MYYEKRGLIIGLHAFIGIVSIQRSFNTASPILARLVVCNACMHVSRWPDSKIEPSHKR